MGNGGISIWNGEIERLGWGGVGIARNPDGKMILLECPLALFPGEVVTAEIRWKSRHAEGIVTGWEKADAQRCAPECGVAEKCGGCSLWGAGNFAPDLKKFMVDDLVSRAIKDAPEVYWLPAPDDTRRYRIQLHFDGKNLGFAKKKSREIINVNNCPMAAQTLTEAIPLLKDALLAGNLPKEFFRWELDCGLPENGVFLHPTGNRELTFRLSGDIWQRTNDRISYFFKTGTMTRTIGTFFQACPDWAYSSFSALFDIWNLRGSKFFDVYGGCGFISFVLKDRFDNFTLVEFDSDSCNDAKRNLSDLNLQVINDDAFNWMKTKPAIAKGLVFLDPPRSGLGPKLAKLLCDSNASEIILLGCDGAAFARDANALQSSFHLVSLAAIDLFPNTPHVEFAGRFQR